MVTLLKDMQKLEKSGLLSLDDFTRILKTMSGSSHCRHLLTFDSWIDFLVVNIHRMSLRNINDIETVLENLSEAFAMDSSELIEGPLGLSLYHQIYKLVIKKKQ